MALALVGLLLSGLVALIWVARAQPAAARAGSASGAAADRGAAGASRNRVARAPAATEAEWSERPAPTEAPVAAEGPRPTEPPPLPAVPPPLPDDGPWARPAAAPDRQPVVLRADRLADLAHWLKANWVYVVSALSLALAGVFFVQYGIENGLLTPWMRVAGALLLGLVLVVAGDWLRRHRQSGDASAFLPATFAAAGLVSMFAGVVAARQLYGLIDPGTALVGLVLVGGLGVVLGWFHGPFLAAFGLIGAAAAPFLVGGGSVRR